MNILHKIELATYELAEAERHERAARKHRIEAAKYLASAHAEMAEACAKAKKKPSLVKY